MSSSASAPLSNTGSSTFDISASIHRITVLLQPTEASRSGDSIPTAATVVSTVFDETSPTDDPSPSDPRNIGAAIAAAVAPATIIIAFVFFGFCLHRRRRRARRHIQIIQEEPPVKGGNANVRNDDDGKYALYPSNNQCNLLKLSRSSCT